ncbi:MAG: radical SAM protein [Bacteroidales bacterium]|jgi:wyosine [tRNA(Phe)-imidazoG37] synthetase (radical SAM superfamily)|nr:radical SAM protein [Bacteroidales bacterium]
MYKHLFGPVPSRRLGMSLGVDLVPHKVCSLNCIYCECGATTNLTTERKEYVSFEEIVSELKDFFENNDNPDYITFSGAGEPTLNIHIGKVINYIKTNYSKVPIAVLTNGSLLSKPDVRLELLQADLILPSLDAATENAFKKIDRPSKNLNIANYIQGLIDFRNEFKGTIWLEIMILPGFNDDLENLNLLKKAIKKINPEKVQLNTLDRPGVIDGIRAASRLELQDIIDLWKLNNVEIIASSAIRKDNKSFRKDTENAIMETISRRPCTLEDLEKILGLHINEINKYLDTLDSDNKIDTYRQERGVFYQLKQ